jgi:hypothetical protein
MYVIFLIDIHLNSFSVLKSSTCLLKKAYIFIEENLFIQEKYGKAKNLTVKITPNVIT